METKTKNSVVSNEAPEALGAYSQAVQVGSTVYCSGQVGLNRSTGKLATGVEAQAQQALTNIQAVLRAADYDVSDVVKVTIFMTDVADFNIINAVYAKFFQDNQFLPSRSAVGVKALPAGALVEIEAIAQK